LTLKQRAAFYFQHNFDLCPYCGNKLTPSVPFIPMNKEYQQKLDRLTKTIRFLEDNPRTIITDWECRKCNKIMIDLHHGRYFFAGLRDVGNRYGCVFLTSGNNDIRKIFYLKDFS
jgi:uncharacterized protein with PIN domain